MALKMNSFIEIISTETAKDAAGFAIGGDHIIASVRAYREDRHGTKMWANRAAFSTATCLFRFRIIPGTAVTDKMVIICGTERFRIVSAEDVRGRGMYIEVLAERLEASKSGKSGS